MAKSSANQLDLLASYKEQQREAGRGRRTGVIITSILVAFMFLAVGAVYVLVQRDRLAIQAQIDEVEAQLYGEELQQQIAEADGLGDQLRARLGYNNILSTHLELLKLIRRPDSQLFEDIEKLAVTYEVTCVSLSYSSGSVVLECTSPSGSAAASFAKALEGTLLQDVSFFGYTYIESENCFSFSVQGTERGA